jgi:Na+/melibiose symporter-like transporter
VIVLLASLVYAFIEGPGRGWTAAGILACFALAAAALAGLIGYERRREEPLIDLRFFRSVPFSGAVAMAICSFAALGGFLLVNTIYLQNVRGYSPLLAGLYVLPMAVMSVVFPPVSGMLVGRFGTRPPLVIAGIFLTASGVLLTRLATDTSTAMLVGTYVVFGIGFGFVNPPITNNTVSGMPTSQAGVAAGITSTSRQIGSSLGVAVIGSVTISALHGPFSQNFAAASHAGWWILTACGAGVLGLGMLASGSWAHRTAQRTARILMPATQDGDAQADGAGSAPEDLRPARSD